MLIFIGTNKILGPILKLMDQLIQKAGFAGGCFWGVQQLFDKMLGVISSRVGYMGGNKDNPTYEEVCSGNTGHAETLEITYDANQISYGDLLDRFWILHDPTTKDRQGPDVGSQYRSVIFYYTPEQKIEAEKSKTNLGNSGKFSNPIVTEIVSASIFWPAEDYHQKYNKKNGLTCHIG